MVHSLGTCCTSLYFYTGATEAWRTRQSLGNRLTSIWVLCCLTGPIKPPGGASSLSSSVRYSRWRSKTGGTTGQTCGIFASCTPATPATSPPPGTSSDSSPPRWDCSEVLMEELLQERWRERMVPLVVQGNFRLPFGLRNIRPIPLLDDPSTAEMVSSFISVDTQMEVRAKRRRSEEIFNNQLRRQRARRLVEIRETVTELRQRFGDDFDPTTQLDQMTEALRNITVADVPGVDQQVNLSNCNNVNVGPSIHFIVRCDDSTTPPHPSSPSTNRHGASTSAYAPSTTDLTTDFNDSYCGAVTESTYAASVTL
ncbi:uncharacterized protein LOC135113602 isoform X2 [Scylla paramamosain]|uniref:uncharacterized protein LOC135113602 isoform X2 n=1 Tax=Scylla paramamosain TaxID=85552 RepID=UPI0030835DC1